MADPVLRKTRKPRLRYSNPETEFQGETTLEETPVEQAIELITNIANELKTFHRKDLIIHGEERFIKLTYFLMTIAGTYGLGTLQNFIDINLTTPLQFINENVINFMPEKIKDNQFAAGLIIGAITGGLITRFNEKKVTEDLVHHRAETIIQGYQHFERLTRFFEILDELKKSQNPIYLNTKQQKQIEKALKTTFNASLWIDRRHRKKLYKSRKKGTERNKLSTINRRAKEFLENETEYASLSLLLDSAPNLSKRPISFFKAIHYQFVDNRRLAKKLTAQLAAYLSSLGMEGKRKRKRLCNNKSKNTNGRVSSLSSKILDGLNRYQTRRRIRQFENQSEVDPKVLTKMLQSIANRYYRASFIGGYLRREWENRVDLARE